MAEDRGGAVDWGRYVAEPSRPHRRPTPVIDILLWTVAVVSGLVWLGAKDADQG